MNIKCLVILELIQPGPIDGYIPIAEKQIDVGINHITATDFFDLVIGDTKIPICPLHVAVACMYSSGRNLSIKRFKTNFAPDRLSRSEVMSLLQQDGWNIINDLTEQT